MKHTFTALIALAAALAVVVSAAPAVRANTLHLPELMDGETQTPVEAEARAEDVSAHVFICTDINFAGDCTNYGFNSGQCSNFPGEFQDDISSFGPDQGWECIMYTDINCQGLTYTGVWPGFSTLPPGINDAISSVLCFPQ
ncbi:hypothetical protein C8F01DRAFT_1086374 [Mycena amicta]|nr:hypothetical protein C8F01DRAFT_1086374 [Mycena amicta]